jgi:hypothetical protein
MSFFTKNRIRNWLLIFLLVTNIATVGSIFYHSWKFKQRMSTDTHRRLKDFIDNDLKFSDEQKAKLETDKKNIRTKKEDLYDKLENYRVEVYTEFSKASPDTTVIDSIARQTGVSYTEINRSSIEQYYSLFALCNAEQKTKLAKFFKDMATDISTEMKEEQQEHHDDDHD